MAETFKVYVDGQYKTFTAAEYEAQFGFKPTSPREGERLFGGRYEHRTFVTASLADEHTNSPDSGNTWKNTGNSTTSSRAGGY